MPSKVQFRVRKEDVHVGAHANAYSEDRCAVLSRYGRPLREFVITAAQRRALKKGRTISVTSRSITKAQIFCSRYGR